MVKSVVANPVAATSHALANPLMVLIARLELLAGTDQLDACGRLHLQVALAAAEDIKKKVHWLSLPPMLDLEKSSQR
jgi:hypothetical protein